MRPTEETERLIRNVPVNTNAEKDKEVLNDVLTAMEKSKNKRSTAQKPNIWRIIMKSKISRLAAALIIVAAVFSFFVLDKLGSPAWALEQTIEALKDFKAVHMVGAFSGGTLELWMRANEAGTQSGDILVKGSHGAITWIEDGSTYHYEPSQNTVYYENAITQGFSHWLGPELFEMLGKAKNAKTMRGKDPATGRDRILLMCGVTSNEGPESWIIEFDAASKLPISLKQWPNHDRSGPPAFEAFKITYYENLDDSIFDVRIAGNPVYVERPLTIPEANLDLLSDPQCGISTEGLSRDEACQEILRQFYEAVVNEDLDEIKQLCPACATWGDELLKYVVLGKSEEEKLAELVEIRPICKEGQSKLGPIVAVPWILKARNGKIREDKQIIQFREIDGQTSCVIHGPYGFPRKLE